MSELEQYQGQPAEGYRPLAHWGKVEALSREELEAWKRSPVTRLESRVITAIADLERQLAEAQGKLKEMERFTYDLHRQSGHPDPACLRCLFHAKLKGESE